MFLTFCLTNDRNDFALKEVKRFCTFCSPLRRLLNSNLRMEFVCIFFDFILKNLIDGASFIGVGFDGRGDFSPESRKMSIVQRDCKGKAT